jgi:hypothetical protein
MLMNGVLKLTVKIGGHGGITKTFDGRFAWTLLRLIEAGENGVTPMERPAPRWSAYVFVLRREGLVIETIEERHSGPYAGRHGRYVLRTAVVVIDRKDAA